jgi:hypothetical protein
MRPAIFLLIYPARKCVAEDEQLFASQIPRMLGTAADAASCTHFARWSNARASYETDCLANSSVEPTPAIFQNMWSGYEDLNLGPSAAKAVALHRLSYTPKIIRDTTLSGRAHYAITNC